MSNVLKPGTPKPNQNEELGRREGSLDRKSIDKLPPNQRKWADNVLRVLKLPQKGAQARILAGSIATTETIVQNNPNDLVLQKKAKDLLGKVTSAGTPPWKDTKKAMIATASKVELDLLSLPDNERTLQRFKADNVNPTFWINRKDPDGNVRNAFLCKTPNTNPQVGLPIGGEVIREALVGRAAQTFSGITGLDLNMPETHVISLDPQYLPQNMQGQGAKLCSVQEARPNQGALNSLSAFKQLELDAEQVGAMAIFDTMTLNTDRHVGNVLVDEQKNLIPIDHGYSLVEPGDGNSGNKRIAVSLAGPNNALTRIAAAHRPMSDKMLKKLKSIDPAEYAKSLRKDRDLIAGEHPGMKDLVSDQAIESARRSALFVKLAASHKPPLTPAAIQIALGTVAAEFLDPQLTNEREIKAKALETIKRFASSQDVLKSVCAVTPLEFNALIAAAAELGWVRFQAASEATDGVLLADPLLLAEIVANGIKRDSKKKESVQIKEIRSASSDAKKLTEKLLFAKVKMVTDLSAYLPKTEREQVSQQAMRVTQSGSLDDQLHYANLLAESTCDAVARTLQNEAQQLQDEYVLSEGATNWIVGSIVQNKLKDLALEIKKTRDGIANGTIIQKSLYEAKSQRLDELFKDYDIPLDPYLKGSLLQTVKDNAYREGKFAMLDDAVNAIEDGISKDLIQRK